MADNSSAILTAVEEIRDLIRLMAEPAIAERDRKLRDELRKIVGRSTPKAKSVLLMDGSRTRKRIIDESAVNKGHLSTLVKELKKRQLVSEDGNRPRLLISVPATFFEKNEEAPDG